MKTFDTTGEALLGISANDLERLRHTPDQFQAALEAVCSREFTFECHVDEDQVSTQRLALILIIC